MRKVCVVTGSRAEYGILRTLMQAIKDAKSLKLSDGAQSAEGVAPSETLANVNELKEKIFTALCDDMNTPVALSHIYELVKIVNIAKEGKAAVNELVKEAINSLFKEVVTDIMGLVDEETASSEGQSNSAKIIEGLMDYVIAERKAARANKDWGKSDQIRDTLKALGIQLKDNKDGTTTWENS